MSAAAKELRWIRRGTSYCIFSRGGREVAVAVGASGQVVTGGVVQPVSDVPPYVVGVMDHERGALPVVRIDAWLDIVERPYEVGGQVLLVECDEFRVGVVVDRVREVRLIDDEEIKPPSEADVASPLFRACWQSGARWVLVLDAERLVGQVLTLRDHMPQWNAVAHEDLTARLQVKSSEQYCVFSRGNRDLALPIAAARETLGAQTITPVPQAPPQLVGVLNLRGDLLPLICIDGWLGLPPRAASATDQIVVVESGGVLLGIVVDRVHDVRRIEMQQVKSYIAASEVDVIFRGTSDTPLGRIALLDADRLIEVAVEVVSGGFRQSSVGQAASGRGNVTGRLE
jgi:purine-binding chemotaxis protein CheW